MRRLFTVFLLTLAVISCGDDEYFRYDKHGTPATMADIVGTWSANFDDDDPVRSNNYGFLLIREDASTILLSPSHSEIQTFCFKVFDDAFITDYGDGRFFFGEKEWMIYLYKGSLAFYGRSSAYGDDGFSTVERKLLDPSAVTEESIIPVCIES